jgi:NhaP-type Na+/H+ or K+/H+ antiporter
VNKLNDVLGGLSGKARVLCGALVAFGMSVIALGAGAVAASAAVPSAVETATTGLQTDATSFITTYGIPLVFGLLIIGIAVGLAMRFARKGAKAAGGT